MVLFPFNQFSFKPDPGFSSNLHFLDWNKWTFQDPRSQARSSIRALQARSSIRAPGLKSRPGLWEKARAPGRVELSFHPYHL